MVAGLFHVPRGKGTNRALMRPDTRHTKPSSD